MKSRISLFNKTVLKKDLTRFLGAWLAYCIYTALGTMATLELDAEFTLMYVAESLNYMAFANAIFALVAAGCLFGDLFNSRLCNGLHALPVRRETWMFTHLLSAILFWLVPTLVEALALMPGLGHYWYLAFVWLLGMAMQYLFFLSLAVLCAMCTGTKVAMLTMYLALNFASMIVYWFVTAFYQPLMVGVAIPEEWFTFFSPGLHISELELMKVTEKREVLDYMTEYTYGGLGDGWIYLSVLVALAVVFTALALVAYRRRRLESAGEFVVFRPLRPVVWVMLTLVIGAMFQGIGLLVGDTVISLLIGLVLGGLLAELLMARSVKKALKGLAMGAVVAGVVGVSLIVVALDPLNITGWQPKAEQVESVTIRDYHYYGYGDYDPALILTDAEDIQTVIDAHGLLIKEGLTESEIMMTDEIGSIFITYRLKDGTEKVREYTYDMNSDAGRAAERIFCTAEYVLGYRDWDQFLSNLSAGILGNWNGDNTLTQAQTRELVTAIREDCDNGYWNRTHYDMGLYLVLDELYIDIPDNCPATSAWLKENVPQF